MGLHSPAGRRAALAPQAHHHLEVRGQLPERQLRRGKLRVAELEVVLVAVLVHGSQRRGAALDQFREIEGAGDAYYNIYGEDSLYTCDNARIYHATPVGGSD